MKFSFSLMVLVSVGLVNSASVKAEPIDCKSVLSEKMNALLRVSIPDAKNFKSQTKASQNQPSSGHELAQKYEVLMSKIDRSPSEAPSAK